MTHWQKLGRAYEHLEIVERTIERFLKMKPCRLVGKYDREPPFENGEEVLYRFTMDAPAKPPSELSFQIGDFLTNLRATLDHLVFAIAIRHTNGDLGKWERDVSFPIYHDARRFAAKRGKLVNVLPLDVLALIEKLQPYYGRRTVDKRHALFALEDLVNRDKHRTILVVSAFAVGNYFVHVEGGEANGSIGMYGTRAYDHGAEVVAPIITAQSPEPKVRMDPEPTPDVAFGEIGPLSGKAVRHLLYVMANHVRNVVFPGLEGFL